ncbi:MAG: Phage protein GP46 [Syntrophus sp. PtaB.Bin001]|nr:MAG: Phage protein GP46 [Syntrophus sp. PtaB.Bin001]
MSDIAVIYDPDKSTFSWSVTKPGLTQDAGLETAVLLSLFSDRIAREDDVLPSGDDRRGWWADVYSDIEGDAWGSRLWLLSREKQTSETLRRAEEYASEALQWLIDDRVVSSVKCTAQIIRTGVLGLTVVMTRGKNLSTKYRFETFWKNGN